MKEILNKFLNLSKNTRFLAVLGLTCSFLCIFFNYIKYTVLGLAVKIKLIEFLEGKLMILLIILNLMFIFKDYVKKYVPKLFENNIGRKIYNINNQKWILIPVGLSVIFAFVVKGETKTEFLNTTYGLGFYLMWLGVISLVAYAFIYKNDKIKTLDATPKQSGNTNAQSSVSLGSIANQEIQASSNPNQENVANTAIEQSISQVSNQSVAEEQAHKFCVNCGTKCEKSAVKCPACGKDF